MISADTDKADKLPIRPIIGLTDNRSTTIVCRQNKEKRQEMQTSRKARRLARLSVVPDR